MWILICMRRAPSFMQSAALVVLTLTSLQVNAWSLRTHIWISQEVINDVIADGRVTIAGRQYPVKQAVVEALRNHAAYYRMGHLGPDVFPDPITGQVTTHPGIANGWQTDDWLKHVLANASTPQEVAFAYGYVGHAAGDIFAHTYVNAYSGGIFDLSDSGSPDVERRHFALEKYIESKTPTPRDLSGTQISTSSLIRAPERFLANNLIFSRGVSEQNLRGGASSHLAAMFLVRESAQDTLDGIENVQDLIRDWIPSEFGDIDLGDYTLDGAEEALNAAERILDVKERLHNEALNALSAANQIVQDNPELINGQGQLLIQQTKIAADAAADAARIAQQTERAISDIQRTISDVKRELGNLVCKLLFGGTLPKCEELNNEISDLERRISGQRERQRIADDLRRNAERARDDIKNELDRLKRDLDVATQRLADGTYQAAVTASEAELRFQREVVKETRKAVEVVRAAYELIRQYGLLGALVSKWIDDLDLAALEYIRTGSRVGALMVSSSGGIVDEYKEWFECYGPVFLGQPKEVPKVQCEFRHGIDKLNSEYDRIVENIPEPLRWVINPAGELINLAKKELEAALQKAQRELLIYLTNVETADFLLLVSGKIKIDRAKLDQVFRSDENRRDLLVFESVAGYVDRDIGQAEEALKKFPAIQHSITLVKLSLLEPSSLNQLIADFTGIESYDSVYFGNPVFKPFSGHYTLLFDSVRNIDGGHQWQAYGLPWPKQSGVHESPRCCNYSYDFFKDRNKGLPIWVDPFLRERVFFNVFSEPVEGSIGEIPQLSSPAYKFPSCSGYPFPTTQDSRGRILEADPNCSQTSTGEFINGLSFADASGYREAYFSCDGPRLLGNHWTIGASFDTKARADKFLELSIRQFPDMYGEVWRPVSPNEFWTVMFAACTTHEKAQEAALLLKRRQLSRAPFIWEPTYPWERDESAHQRD